MYFMNKNDLLIKKALIDKIFFDLSLKRDRGMVGG